MTAPVTPPIDTRTGTDRTMMTPRTTMMAALLAVAGMAAPLQAQATPAPLDGSVADLRTEITRRYDTAVAATLARDVIAANDSRFLWASEAKVACGIAIGYLKHNTKDADSIARCQTFSDNLANTGTTPATTTVVTTNEPVPPTPPGGCRLGLPVAVYFDWNEDVVPAEGRNIVTQIATTLAACGATGLDVVGYADRSGGDDYNLALSRRRADAVAQALATAGVGADTLRIDARGENDPAVATVDGIREPKNRRVEINATATTK